MLELNYGRPDSTPVSAGAAKMRRNSEDANGQAASDRDAEQSAGDNEGR
jgi:hypothetical protein